MKQWLCDSCKNSFIPPQFGQNFTFKLHQESCVHVNPNDMLSVTIKVENIQGLDICRRCLVRGITSAE